MPEDFYFEGTIHGNREIFDCESLTLNEISISDTQNLNNKLKNNCNLILSLNIRSLNANFSQLEMLIESLTIKLTVIVCPETWNLSYYQYFQIPGHNIYYNESRINQNDGVVMYLKNNLIVDTETVVIGKLSILCAEIRLEKNMFFRISAMYRCHDITKTEFNYNLSKFLKINAIKNVENHNKEGDFNIDILYNNISKHKHSTIKTVNTTHQEFLNNLLENEYSPCFSGITRPNSTNKGSCIDNIFIKFNAIQPVSYKLTNPITEHYPLFLTLDKITLTNDLPQILKSINYRKLTHFVEKLIELINECTDKATINNNKIWYNTQRFPRKKWITSAIIKSCKTKKTLYTFF